MFFAPHSEINSYNVAQGRIFKKRKKERKKEYLPIIYYSLEMLPWFSLVLSNARKERTSYGIFRKGIYEMDEKFFILFSFLVSFSFINSFPFPK